MLNLLPPKVKKEQKFKQISNQITIAVVSFLLITGLTYSAIYFVNYSLVSQITKNKEQIEEKNKQIDDLKTVQDDVEGINSKITRIEKLQSQRIDWSEFFKDFNEAIPKTVKIESVTIDKKEKFSISAAAETRADIMGLQAKLEALDNLKEMASTSSTYNDTKKYFTFTMTGTITTKEIKK